MNVWTKKSNLRCWRYCCCCCCWVMTSCSVWGCSCEARQTSAHLLWKTELGVVWPRRCSSTTHRETFRDPSLTMTIVNRHSPLASCELQWCGEPNPQGATKTRRSSSLSAPRTTWRTRLSAVGSPWTPRWVPTPHPPTPSLLLLLFSRSQETCSSFSSFRSIRTPNSSKGRKYTNQCIWFLSFFSLCWTSSNTLRV